MTRVQQLIEGLRSRNNLVVEDREDAWLMRIPMGQAMACVLTIPRARFEWFASVTRVADKTETWSDWMDHYGSSREELDAEMAVCISAFVERVVTSGLQSPFRIHEGTD
ncbi:MAG: hypothetical protein NTV51_03420 [Verrucomicrobia bacterium]|nr:hypothetical protein [Verrucomicrobiota bacterium]